MRPVAEIKYETVIKSDVDERKIYGFYEKKDKSIATLCVKDGRFFWNSIKATNIVWYQMYNSIEEAIDGILGSQDYKNCECGPVIEFDNLQEFIDWASSLFHPINVNV